MSQRNARSGAPRGSSGGALGQSVFAALRAATAAIALLATGCGTVQYLIQAGMGQLDISNASRPIEDVVKNPDVDARIRGLLGEVPAIKRFGEKEGLTPTPNYRRYADLGRPAAVWVVSACAPLAFRSKTWWFPVTGRVPYLGYFARPDANQLADYLRDRGWDADVRGASAYSTIGYFDDPVLSTMISPDDDAIGELADVVLHESVHATVYVPNQAGLNESVASFIADKLTPIYLNATRGPKSKEERAWLASQDAYEKRVATMRDAYARLSKLYASSAPDDQKRIRKAEILAELERKVRARRHINNATLAEMKTYGSGTKEMEALLTACDGDFPRMIAALKTLDGRDFKGPVDRDLGKVIQPLVDRKCPSARGGELAKAK